LGWRQHEKKKCTITSWIEKEKKEGGREGDLGAHNRSKGTPKWGIQNCSKKRPALGGGGQSPFPNQRESPKATRKKGVPAQKRTTMGGSTWWEGQSALRRGRKGCKRVGIQT